MQFIKYFLIFITFFFFQKKCLNFRYIYGGELELENNSFKTNAALLIAADELSLNGLSLFIENYLLKNEELLEQNFVFVLQDITNGLNRFAKLSQLFAQKDALLIFKANDFTSIKQGLLIALLDIILKHKLCVKPIEIWDKIIEWTNAQSNGSSSDVTKWIIQPFISFINFKEISRLDFYRKIRPFKDIFDDNFYLEIIEHYCFKDFQLENYIDSQIINFKEASFISSRIMKQQRKEITYDFNLLIRGSRDGFSDKTFHEYCDNKGPTITTIRVRNSNEVLGGFNPCSWISKIGYISVEESFIFSLDRK
jgi:hypothetical protein